MSTGSPPSERRKILSWALYDWANSAFATTIVSGFFPILFKKYWSAGTDPSLSTLQLGIANSSASIIVAILAPFLGSVADCGGIKRRFLIFFMTLGASMSAGLYLVSKGQWELAIIFYVLASIGFFAGNGFYDSQLVDVADSDKFHKVSAMGYALGYLGGGTLFSLNVYMTLNPQFFGLANAAEAAKVSFILVGIWWATFSIPIILYVKDPPRDSNMSYRSMVVEGFQELKRTGKDIKSLKIVALFLAAYWLYIDGVGTIIKMSVDYGMSIGLQSKSLITALLITQFIGFPATFGFTWLANKYSAKAGIYIGLVIYIVVTIFGYFMQTEMDFYMLAATVGLVMGGVQSLSRSVFASIIPQNRSGEFFGFFNMFGKFAAVMGPAVMGYVGYITESPRLSILSLIFFFITGGILLHFVDLKKGAEMATKLEETRGN